MSDVVVTLALHEIAAAISAGTGRHLRAIQNRRVPVAGFGNRGRFDWKVWYADVEAVAAEIAVARSLDRYWIDSPLLDRDGDVGPLQVRHTTREDGQLIIRPGDDNDASFILCVGRLPSFRVVGWAVARECKHDAHWYDDNGRPGCWMLPQAELHDLEELRP